MSRSNHSLRDHTPRIASPVKRLWYKVPEDIRLNLELNFIPEDPRDKLLPNEVVELEFGLAWYRDVFGHIVFHMTYWYLGVTAALTMIFWGVAILQGFDQRIAFVPILVALVVLAYGIYEHIEHMQWKFVKTNARLVISIPVHGQWPLVDNIEMKGLPNVVDTNWTKNPYWRFFQAITGARDLYISLLPFQFEGKSAQVRGALIIPDVMPNDVWELKKLVFRAN
jgi:hypothetical protein